MRNRRTKMRRCSRQNVNFFDKNKKDYNSIAIFRKIYYNRKEIRWERGIEAHAGNHKKPR